MKITRNPFFYLSIVLFFAVAFEVYGLVNAQTAGTWTAPTVAPPGGNPAQPIDTSNLPQSKTGGLTITDNSGTYGTKITPGGYILFGTNNGDGTVNTSLATDAAIGVPVGSNVLEYRNPGDTTWHAVGSGSGTGPTNNIWQYVSGNSGDIYYSGGNVIVSNAVNSQQPITGFWKTSSCTATNCYPSGAINLSGQPSTSYPDGTVYQPSGNYTLNQSKGYIQTGSRTCSYYLNGGICAWWQGTDTYDIYTYKTKNENSNGVNTATVTAGNYLDNYGTLVPYGTLCGLFVPPENGYNGISIPCGGSNTGPGPTLGRNCPSGYINTKFGKGILTADDLETCVKNY